MATLEEIHHVLTHMPDETEIERRNRAMIAFALLTCARADALASLRLKHIDLEERCAFQHAREVRTKFSKSFPTFFFPVGGNAFEILSDWVILRRNLIWGDDDPLFPATRLALDDNKQFTAAGQTKEGWRTSAPVRRIFKDAFIAAGLPYFNPHSFRDTLTRLGEQMCKSPEQLIAWAQNMGHDDPMTTIKNYGAVERNRLAVLIRNAGLAAKEVPDVSAAIAILQHFHNQTQT